MKFDPIYQYRIWGGRRLTNLLSKPLPPDDPIGEAWILSDREDHSSKVTEGDLKGKTISQLMEHHPRQLMGKLDGKFKKFPLLLKFLDCRQVLSVQVHPSDDRKKYIPKGDTGKTESWVVLEAGKDAVIYAGLKPGTNEDELKALLAKNNVADALAHFKPHVGDSVLIKAGTVHTLGDVVVFEVQENIDTTYRLYDWDRVDKKTGKPRDLQVEQAMACIDFNATAIKPVKPVIETRRAELRERLIADTHFTMWRLTGRDEFNVGENDTPRILVCVDGGGALESDNESYPLSKGEVMLLPAVAGQCNFIPKGKVVLLEIALPGE